MDQEDPVTEAGLSENWMSREMCMFDVLNKEAVIRLSSLHPGVSIFSKLAKWLLAPKCFLAGFICQFKAICIKVTKGSHVHPVC